MRGRGVYTERLAFTLTAEQRDRFIEALDLLMDRGGRYMTLSSVVRGMVVRWTDVVLRERDEP